MSAGVAKSCNHLKSADCDRPKSALRKVWCNRLFSRFRNLLRKHEYLVFVERLGVGYRPNVWTSPIYFN